MHWNSKAEIACLTASKCRTINRELSQCFVYQGNAQGEATAISFFLMAYWCSVTKLRSGSLNKMPVLFFNNGNREHDLGQWKTNSICCSASISHGNPPALSSTCHQPHSLIQFLSIPISHRHFNSCEWNQIYVSQDKVARSNLSRSLGLVVYSSRLPDFIHPRGVRTF